MARLPVTCLLVPLRCLWVVCFFVQLFGEPGWRHPFFFESEQLTSTQRVHTATTHVRFLSPSCHCLIPAQPQNVSLGTFPTQEEILTVWSSWTTATTRAAKLLMCTTDLAFWHALTETAFLQASVGSLGPSC